jgi:soluble lytic murein transglycosylase
VNIDLRKNRMVLIVLGLLIVACVAFAPFMSASCHTLQQRPGESQATEQLRAMTRNGVIPADSALTAFENEYPDSRLAGLARIVRARARLKAYDFAGAAELLNSSPALDRTGIGDYVLLMRGRALEQGGRPAEARAVYEKLARDYPSSLRSREAVLQDASILMSSGQAAGVPGILKQLSDKNDATALLRTAKAYEQSGDSTRALQAYRRIYFYASASAEATEAAPALARLGSTTSPALADEAFARANMLYNAKRYAEAANAFADAFSRFNGSATLEMQLRRGIAASNARMTADAVSVLSSIPTSAGEKRAEAMYYLAQTYATARQMDQARATLDEMKRSFPQSGWTPRAFVNAGNIAQNAKLNFEASNLFKSAVAAFPGTAEVAQAQFELAWMAHQSRNFQESSRLLTEHLALYADKNTDNRGRAGYWAARDLERAGKISEARVVYKGMQARYDANWYGYLSKQRLDALNRSTSTAGRNGNDDDSMVSRAVANLQNVTVAAETANSVQEAQILKGDALSVAGLDDWALDELNKAADAAPASPRVNLALAKLYRSRNDNVQALNVLKRSYPDYSQMKPEELTREEWDVFYPLSYWSFIKDESRAKNLDPYQVAGLIRQESVFNPKARSGANAFGLMQLVLPTARATAQRYGVNSSITVESLYEPKLNIQLGTGYLRDQLDKFGRIEYVAAAYNAGPGRVVQWRTSLPLELDEWAEAIPFKETRGYVQGVVRNTMQYMRLYDNSGNFRAAVGTRAVNPRSAANQGPEPINSSTESDPTVIRERMAGGEEEAQ